MDKDRLLSVSDFNGLVRNWAVRVQLSASSTLSSSTHASGRLLRSLANFVDENDKTNAAYKVKFQFERYGVFRAYGVGRGYVRYNGVLTRGYRLKTRLNFDEWQNVVDRSLKQGMKSKEINALKAVDLGTVKRFPLDWIDRHLNSNLNGLADIVQEFYGDKAVKQVLESFDNIKINKNG